MCTAQADYEGIAVLDGSGMLILRGGVARWRRQPLGQCPHLDPQITVGMLKEHLFPIVLSH